MVSRARPLGVLGFATGSTYRVTLALVEPIDLDHLAAADRAALQALLVRAEQVADDPPLPEPERLAIAAGDTTRGRALTIAGPQRLDGAAFLFPAGDAS